MLLKKGFHSIVLCLALFMCTVWSIEIVITQLLGTYDALCSPFGIKMNDLLWASEENEQKTLLLKTVF